MRIGFYAANVGPGKMMNRLASAAESRGHEALVCPPLGPEPLEPYLPRFRDECAMVVLGFSPDQSPDRRETVAIEGVRGKTPIVRVEDFPKIALTDTEDLRRTAADAVAVFTALPGYGDQMIRFGYAKGAIQHVGPPPHWQSDMEAVRVGRALRESGALRKVRRGDPSSETAVDPQDPNTRIAYVSGGMNIVQEGELMVQIHRGNPEVVLHYRGHPGERSYFTGREQEFEQLQVKLEKKLDGAWKLANYELCSPTEPELRQTADAKCIGAADMYVANPGAASLNWAGYAGIIVAAAFTTLRPEEKERFDYEFIAPRVARIIRELRETQEVVRELFTSEGRERLRELQRTKLELEKGAIEWNTAPKIIAAIEQLLKRGRSRWR